MGIPPSSNPIFYEAGLRPLLPSCFVSLLTPFLVIPEPPPVSAFAAVMASPASVVTRVVTKLVSSTTPTSTLRAAPQGGVLEGGNPSHYDPKNPIILFIIQVCGP